MRASHRETTFRRLELGPEAVSVMYGLLEGLRVVAAPRLGEHTEDVLTSVLHLLAVEIVRLHDTGVAAGPAAQ